MKRIFYAILFFSTLSIAANAQLIKNNSFENWTYDEAFDDDILEDWKAFYFYGIKAPAIESDESYDGNASVQIQANDFGTAVPVSYWMAYSDFSQTHFNGYYKSVVSKDDKVTISVEYRKAKKVTQSASFEITESASEWTFFQFPLKKDAEADSIRIVFIPSETGDTETITQIDLVNFDQMVSIESNNISSLNVYPNPATSLLNVKIGLIQNSNVEAQIVDMSGRIVLAKSFTNLNSGEQNIQLNTSDLNTGIYTLVINTNGVLTRELLNIR